MDPISALVGGATIVSGLIGGKKQERAGGKMARAITAASQAEQDRFGQLLNMLSPYRNVGAGALSRLENFRVEDTPGYQYALGESRKALDRRLKSLGMYGSGRAIQEDLNLTGQLSGQEAQRQFENLLSLASLGRSGYVTPQPPSIVGPATSAAGARYGIQSQLGADLPSLVSQGVLTGGALYKLTGGEDDTGATRGLQFNPADMSRLASFVGTMARN